MGIMRPGARIVWLTITIGSVVAALTATASGLPAPSRAKNAAACSPVRVNGGPYVGNLTVRFGLIGHVSCATAQQLARTYFHKMATGQCGKLNNFCDLSFQGWDCSIFFATESQQAGGAAAGCSRMNGRTRVRFFTHRVAADTVGRHAAPRSSHAGERLRGCGNYPALHVEIQVQGVSCAKARRIVRAYLHGDVGTGGFERVKGYPAWTCSTGDRLGTCSKGRVASSVPEIDFSYLEPPG